ncbi:hypothetical protein SAMN03080617_04164 [Algoriphagus alkaliphilus]|uniref:DNA helicase n=1 Tax=Algoriphagus alkaliphilus TaxID=279824 RepID=A0A1G5ZNA2_9BACT|nr:AAA family ATPase [Algoriphagus alkaliphilus]SDA96006.1 hypothetical protein SAMN03080617_04164 [Algoriphagus alkaliphilus]
MIYPNTFPEYRKNFAEKVVFDALSDLGDEFEIFYNKSFAKRHHREPLLYEVDFLIFDLRGGKLNYVFVVEVKGGAISYSAKRNLWYSGDREMEKGPDEQAASYVRNLISRYEKVGANAVPFIWLLWFPDGVKKSKEYLPSQLDKWRVLDQYALTDPTKFIDNTINQLPHNFKHFGGLTFEKYQEVIQKDLLADFDQTPNLKALLHEINLTYDQLATNQKAFFTGLTDLPRLAISGGAGSGKSILAKFAATYFTEEGKNVLLLCFNKQLKNDLSKGLPKIVLVDHVLNFMSSMIHQFTGKAVTADLENLEDYYLNVLPTEFFTIIQSREWKDAELFDAIVIDEGQDMKGEWLEWFVTLLKPEGKYFIFFDERQNIFNRDFRLPQSEVWTPFKLSYNYRNSKNINSYINSHLNLSLIPGVVPEGREVMLKSYTSQENLLKEISKILFQLIRKDEIPHSLIKIMLDGSLRSWEIEEWKLDFEFNLALLDPDKEQDKNVIYLTSINRFKGCESDVLILVLKTPLFPIPDEKMRYTQLSRAKGLLIIFEKLEEAS